MRDKFRGKYIHAFDVRWYLKNVDIFYKTKYSNTTWHKGCILYSTRSFHLSPTEIKILIAIVLVFLLIVRTIIWHIKRRSIFANGFDGMATFVHYTEGRRYGYYLCYRYTDENGEEHVFKDQYSYSKDQVDKIERMKNFPIKFIGKMAVVCVDL